MVFEIDGVTTRRIILMIMAPFFIVFCIILGVLILRKDSKYWANRFFASTFWCFSLSLGFTLIYLFSENPVLIIILNFLAISMANFASFMLFLGILIIYKGEGEIIKGKIHYLVIIILIIVNFFRALIPEGIRIEFNVPIWSIAFGIYELILGETLFTIILFFSLKLYSELLPDMKKKFKYFILGVIFVDITILSIIINNMHIIPGFEIIRNLLSIAALVGAILIYFGIIKR